MSKEIFECNIKAMEKWYPAFAEQLRKGDYELDELEIAEEISQDGELIFRIKKEERLLYLNGKRNAKEPADVWMEHLGEIHKYAPVFLLGTGSGIYLKKLIEKTDKTVAIVAYEPSLAVFLRMLEKADLVKEIENRPIIFIVKGLNELAFDSACSQIVSFENRNFLKVEVHPNYQELFYDEVLEKTKLIQKREEFVYSNQVTGINFSTYMARNQMANMKYLCEGYHVKCLMKTVPHDRPAILVSAGPSLNKNIMELKAAKNRAFILAVDTAMKPLLHAGIRPDAFCTIDPMKPLNLVQEDEARDIPIIVSASANTDILEQQRGKKIFYSDGHILAYYAYAAVGKTLPPVANGGSVACAGLSLLYKLGFDTIILVGQDLAYTDNRSHADGTFQDVMPEENTEGMLLVKGNYEETLPTLGNLKMYLDWFEAHIKGMKEHRPAVRVINATAGGAYIEGTELMSLRDAIEENCTQEAIDFEACIEKIEPEFINEDRNKVVKYLHSIPERFLEIHENAKKLYTAYHKINLICRGGNMNRADYEKLLKKVKKITKKCEHNSMYQIVSSTMTVGEYIVKSESLHALDTIEEEAKAVSKQGMRYAKLLQQCTKILKEYAEETLLSIQ